MQVFSLLECGLLSSKGVEPTRIGAGFVFACTWGLCNEGKYDPTRLFFIALFPQLPEPLFTTCVNGDVINRSVSDSY